MLGTTRAGGTGRKLTRPASGCHLPAAVRKDTVWRQCVGRCPSGCGWRGSPSVATEKLAARVAFCLGAGGPPLDRSLEARRPVHALLTPTV